VLEEKKKGNHKKIKFRQLEKKNVTAEIRPSAARLIIYPSLSVFIFFYVYLERILSLVLIFASDI